MSNLRLANAHTKQKETTETKEARGVPNLASTLVGESTKAQVEELLPPQLNAATASKKAIDVGARAKEKMRSRNLLHILMHQQESPVQPRSVEMRQWQKKPNCRATPNLNLTPARGETKKQFMHYCMRMHRRHTPPSILHSQ